MALVLAMINPPTDIPGLVALKVFNACGGILGRDPNCDFVLPDQQQHVSKHHVRIDFKENQYTLTDTSTNGTRVNTTTLPNGETCILKTGDEIQIGNYKIRTAIQQEAANVQQSEPQAERPKPIAMAETSQTGMQDYIDNLVAQYDVVDKEGSDILGTVGSLDSRNRSANIASRVSLHSASASQSESAISTIEQFDIDAYIKEDSLDNTTGFMAQNLGINKSGCDYKQKHIMMARTELAHEPSLKKSIDKSLQEKFEDNLRVETDEKLFSDDAAVTLLLNALGLKSIQLPQSEYRNFIANLSKVLNSAVDSLIILLRDRSVIKNQLSSSATTFKKSENNPIKLSASVAEVLNKMLIDSNERYLNIDDSFNQSIEDLRKHQTALVAAARRSFDVLMKQFDPKYIDLQLKKTAKHPKLKRNAWKRKDYVGYYSYIEERLQDIFDQAFRDAYSKSTQ
jgi:type VI secretion system FHA domain protein